MKDKYTELTNREKYFLTEYISCRGVRDWAQIISDKMCIEISTIRAHKHNIFMKLCVETQAELMYKLLTEGF